MHQSTRDSKYEKKARDSLSFRMLGLRINRLNFDIPPSSFIAITGANGYIGSRLTDYALRRGYGIYALGRTPLHRAGVVDIVFDLCNPDQLALPPNIKALVHLAAATAVSSDASRRLQIAAAETIAAAVKPGTKFVFMSSQSASQDAVSSYGRMKWAIEAIVAQNGGVSIRPGLVYGGPERGLFGRLCRQMKSFPILPLFIRPRPIVQPIHVDDLAEGIMRLVEAEWHGDPVIKLAAPRAIPFDRFLKIVVRRHLGRRRLFLPVPLNLVRFVLSLPGYVSKRDFGATQLASLAKTRVMETTSDLVRLGLQLRPIDANFRQSERRALLNEGMRLLTYILQASPNCSLVRRYVCSLETTVEAPLVKYSGSTSCANLALAILDRRASLDARDRHLAQRLDLALRIAEASPQSFDRFVGGADLSGPQPLRAARTICRVVFHEAFIRILRIFALPLARRVMYGTRNAR